MAESLVGLATVLAKEGKWVEAEKIENEALALFDRLQHAERPDPDTYAARFGDVLEERGRLAEAESLYRGQLAMRRKLYGDANQAVARAFDWLSRVLVKQGKLAEARALSREMMAARPQDQWKIHAPAGRWKEAAASLRQSIELDQNNAEPYLRLAPILLLLGDVDGYRQLCQRIVLQFSGARNIAEVDTLAKVCTIYPGSGVDLGAVAEAAETAVTLGQHTGYRPWSELAKSLAEYRQEHFVGAAEWAQKSLVAAGPLRSRDAAAYLVLAMAQMKLKQETAARAAFARGAEMVEKKLPKLDGGDLGFEWADVIIANLLLREAQSLIEGNSSKTASEVKVER